MKIRYKRRNFRPASVATISAAEGICEEYAEQGYDLTLRQLYYQFVARGLIENSQRSYNNLGNLISDARMAGLLDWDHIVDRTRSPRGNNHWDSPAEILRGAAHSYQRDKWEGQDARVEVWVEKEALAGVVQRAASAMDCRYFSCRGYVSQSAMWRAAQRIYSHLETPGVERLVILHLGDHDPSGIDMSRDIRDRLRSFLVVDHAQETMDRLAKEAATDEGFMEWLKADTREYVDRLEIRRIALNMDQVTRYDPPPNPAKITDSRAETYIQDHGYESWELDALPPDVLDNLIRTEIGTELDYERYEEELRREQTEKGRLLELAREWR